MSHSVAIPIGSPGCQAHCWAPPVTPGWSSTHLDGEIAHHVLHALAHPLHADGKGAIGALLLGPVVDTFLKKQVRVGGCGDAQGTHWMFAQGFAQCSWEEASLGGLWAVGKVDMERYRGELRAG